jgi:hypothetical protein
MAIDEFTLADMQIVMHAVERVCIHLDLTDGTEDLRLRSRISALVIECAEKGERDVQKLIDCARAGLAKDGSHAALKNRGTSVLSRIPTNPGNPSGA